MASVGRGICRTPFLFSAAKPRDGLEMGKVGVRALRDPRLPLKVELNRLKSEATARLVAKGYHPVGDFTFEDVPPESFDDIYPAWWQPVHAVIEVGREVDPESALIKLYP